MTSPTALPALYERYLAAIAAKSQTGRLMPYHWTNLPNPLSVQWMAYGQMLTEFSRELANIINALTLYVPRLEAWGEVLAPLADEQKMRANLEFTDALATVAVCLPAVIRARFAFALAHLCHQANQAKHGGAWRDDMRLDNEIYMRDAERAAAGWREFGLLKLRLEKINGAAFKKATHDFRNAYNHRFSPRFVFGISEVVTRMVNPETKQVSYVFGYVGPLDLAEVAGLLAAERDHCYAAFDAFQALVAEHITAITSSP